MYGSHKVLLKNCTIRNKQFISFTVLWVYCIFSPVSAGQTPNFSLSFETWNETVSKMEKLEM